MKKSVLFFAVVLLLHSCIVRAPKYTRVEKVMKIKTGMSITEVNEVLDVKPYSIKSMDTTQRRVMLYKFRTEDRKTLSFLLKDTNGREVRGPFMDLFAYFNENDTLYRMEVEEASTMEQEKKVNFDKLITFFTVTAPAVAVAIGLSKAD